MWNQLPAEAKKVYQERARVDKERFHREYTAETIANGGIRKPFASRNKKMFTTKAPAEYNPLTDYVFTKSKSDKFLAFMEKRMAEMRENPSYAGKSTTDMT